MFLNILTFKHCVALNTTEILIQFNFKFINYFSIHAINYVSYSIQLWGCNNVNKLFITVPLGLTLRCGSGNNSQQTHIQN